MKVPLAGSLVIAVLLAAVSLGVAGCGSSEEMTLDDYFQEITTIRDKAEQRMDRLSIEVAGDVGPSTPEDELTRLAMDMMRRGLPITAELVEELKDVDPPGAVEDAHAELIDAGDASVGALEGFLEQAEGVETMAELDELLADESIVAVNERAIQACIVLQDIAEANDIDVDLECEA